jgi:hypothetical protein
MSEILKSSSEKDATTPTATATQPYSGDGPTLPIIGAADEALKAFETEKPNKKRKAQDTKASTSPKKPSQAPSQATNHPSLYEPWTRLPTELLKLLETQSRLRGAQNIVPVVFSRNQNVKTGINRLKTYLGAYKNPASGIEIPEALKEEDCLIAVSAQGQGATKLVGIVDMVRRIVKPSGGEGQVETWWMYTMLTSIEVEIKDRMRNSEEVEKAQESQDEEEAFEPMDVDGREQLQSKEKDRDTTKKRNVPVLTVWMTRKKIPAFKNTFGEQSFTVYKMLNDD